MSELRWHPLLNQWIITATERQERTFLPPKDFCPLCPTQPGGFESEIPVPTYDIAVFENKFPSLRAHPPAPAVEATQLSPVEIAQGICEVIVYTPQHDLTLADLPISRIEHLIAVWTDRYKELGALDYVNYVFIFENKGEVIGVTLHHPHGQIYALPFVPPILERELTSSAEHWTAHQRCLLCDVLASEVDTARGQRVVAENERFVAFIPFFARWPYEVYLMPRQHLGGLDEFTTADRAAMAELLKKLLRGYDGLFNFSFPYMMVIHQKPTDGQAHPEYHFHIEFYPPHRTATKLKYLAGVESGSGAWINDTLAEEKAAELRAAIAKNDTLAEEKAAIVNSKLSTY